MKVALFFDGKNFYKALLRYSDTLQIDYDDMNCISAEFKRRGIKEIGL